MIRNPLPTFPEKPDHEFLADPIFQRFLQHLREQVTLGKMDPIEVQQMIQRWMAEVDHDLEMLEGEDGDAFARQLEAEERELR